MPNELSVKIGVTGSLQRDYAINCAGCGKNLDTLVPSGYPGLTTVADAVCELVGVSGERTTVIEECLEDAVAGKPQDTGVLISVESAARGAVDLMAFKSKQVATAVHAMH